MRYQAPTGTYDILPEDQAYWRHITEKTHQTCSLYGYEQLDVPIFESTALYARNVGDSTDIVEKQMYSFEDRSGDSMTLRPEFTAGLVRAYVEKKLYGRPQPLRLYTIGPAFRYERPQAGRYRQFMQIDVEVIGSQDPAIDLEVMVLAWQLYDDMDLTGLSFQINSTGCPGCRPEYLTALAAFYADHVNEVCEDCHRRLEKNPLRLLDCKNRPCQPILEKAPQIIDSLCMECSDHFGELKSYLDALERPYTINHRLVRGLDYYTKTVFEVWADGIGAQSAICGGGRYDGLTEMIGGPATPAIGFASGMDRVLLTLKHQGIVPPVIPKPTVGVAYLGTEAKAGAVMLVQTLREQQVGATALWENRSLKAQMKHADRIGVDYTLILGEDEIAAGTLTLRSMAGSTQTTLPRDEAIEIVSGRV